MVTQIEHVQPVLMVRDVSASIAFFNRLGFLQAFVDDPAEPRYAGVRRDGIELHVQWHDAAEWDHPCDRPTYRFVVADVDALLEEFKATGVLPKSSVARQTPWGTYEFHLQDPDRNGLQFYRER